MTEDSARFVDALEQVLVALKGTDAAVWGVQHIAAWLDLSPNTVRAKIITQENFPDAFVPTGDPNGERRWWASEVIRFVRENQPRLPRRRLRSAA